MGSLNGNQPGLFLLDSAGKRIYNVTYSNVGANQYWYLMNFGSVAYQSYWINALKADIIDQPWAADGIHADNCLALAYGGGYSATSQWYSTTASRSANMNFIRDRDHCRDAWIRPEAVVQQRRDEIYRR
jgi:hypothetical protein